MANSHTLYAIRHKQNFMSFQATHLQFAQKVKDTIKPQDLIRYFSGTLYPDSRYITKIDRAKTHTDVRIEPQKILDLTDDFEKGWQVHLWYDKLAIHDLYSIAMDSPYDLDELQKTEVWAKVTGAKLVEDLYWWQNTDWDQILPYLKFINSPHGEDKQILNDWYRHFTNFYQKQAKLQSYRQQAEFMGIAPEKIELILEYAQNLYNDTPKRAQIEMLMDQVIEKFRNLIISK